VATWLFGDVAKWLRGFGASRLRGYANTWLRGYLATWLFGYAAASLFRYFVCVFSATLVGRTANKYLVVMFCYNLFTNAIKLTIVSVVALLEITALKPLN
jgi:hypothetical protein